VTLFAQETTSMWAVVSASTMAGSLCRQFGLCAMSGPDPGGVVPDSGPSRFTKRMSAASNVDRTPSNARAGARRSCTFTSPPATKVTTVTEHPTHPRLQVLTTSATVSTRTSASPVPPSSRPRATSNEFRMTMVLRDVRRSARRALWCLGGPGRSWPVTKQ